MSDGENNHWVNEINISIWSLTVKDISEPVHHAMITTWNRCEISGFHSSENSCQGLLNCDAM